MTTALEVRVEREKRRSIQVQADRELLAALLRSPAVQILGSYLIIELLQKNNVIGGVGTDFEEGMAMTAISAAVMAQQLAPILPDLLKAGGDALSGLMKAIPLLAAGAGG